MYRELPLIFALTLLPGLAYAGTHRCEDASGSVSYSDRPCATGGAAEAGAIQHYSNSDSEAGADTATRDAYTKDLTAMQAPDAATQACFNYVNTTARFPDPSTSRLLSSTKKWVTVKDVGGRQMVTIGVTSKNEAGMYLGIQSFDCLLMGDNVTVNTGAYDLI